MATFYTAAQVDEQAGLIGQRIKTIKTEIKAYADSVALTVEERDKLESLESSKFLGTFLTSEAIPTENAMAGNYADVDSGVDSVVERWIFDIDTKSFVKSNSEFAGETAASIKTKYESNPNTNVFTDAEKNKLESLTEGVVPNIELASDISGFTNALDNAMNAISTGKATSFTILKSSADFGSTGFHGEYQVNEEEWKTITIPPNVDVSQQYALTQFLEEIVQGTPESFSYTNWEDLEITKTLTDTPLVLVGGSSFLSKDIGEEESFELPATFHLTDRGATLTGISPDYEKVDKIKSTHITTLKVRPSEGEGVDIVAEIFGGPQTFVATAKATLFGE